VSIFFRSNPPPPMSADLFRTKMAHAGLSEAFANAFIAVYNDLVEGRTGMIPESSIEPVATLPSLADLHEEADKALLGQTVVLKLNGGLGTSMGLEKAKSLLPVKGDDTFLDFIAKQVLYLRKQNPGLNLRFTLMNSFSTSDDTKAFFQAKYPDLASDPTLELMQNKAPKVCAKTLEPITWEANPELEWCPPGHGDLYAALSGTGMLDKLLAEGVKYMFVSNSDNLGATLDLRILGYFAKSDAPMLMEVCQRTESDKKGGHLAKDKTTGTLVLRESAQCPKEDEPQFQNIAVHQFFNTNNLWLNLHHLKATMAASGGVIPLPLIRNSKTVDPRDSASPAVYQLETAMGAAIASLPGSAALLVDRTRFAPVKTCNDLFSLKSDAYAVTEDYRLELAPGVSAPPLVDLDGKLYKLVDKLEPLIKNGVPSLKKCTKVTVKGPVEFAAGCVLEGAVEIVNPGSEPRVVTGTLVDQTITL